MGGAVEIIVGGDRRNHGALLLACARKLNPVFSGPGGVGRLKRWLPTPSPTPHQRENLSGFQNLAAGPF